MTHRTPLFSKTTAAAVGSIFLATSLVFSLPHALAADETVISNVMTPVTSTRWRSAKIAVQGGEAYTFTETFSCDATSFIGLYFFYTNGNRITEVLDHFSRTNPAIDFTVDFTIPSGVDSLVILHNGDSRCNLNITASTLTNTSGGSEPTPTATPSTTATPTATAIPSPSPSFTPSPSLTPTPSPSITVTPAPTPTLTPTPTGTPTPSATPTGGNLVQNPSLEDGMASPDAWVDAGYGNNNGSVRYPVAGRTGNKAVEVIITNYTDGDAKWGFEHIPVSVGQNYTYTDYYKASVSTDLTLEYIMLNGSFRYEYVSTIAPSPTEWAKAEVSFTVPAGAASVRMYHLLSSNGILTIDDVSVTSGATTPTPSPSTTPTATPTPSASPAPTSTPGANLIRNPSFESGSSSPINWSQGGFGNNTTIFTYPAMAHTGGKGAKVEMTSYRDGDAKWYFDEVPVTAGQTYTYSDFYRSTIDTELTVQYTLSSGGFQYQYLSTVVASPSTWREASASFMPPAGVVSATVFHVLPGVGSLTIDDVSLTREDGTENPAARGLVTFTFDDGWNSHYKTVYPILENANMKGSFYIITDTMASAPTTTNPNQIDVTKYMNPTMITEMHNNGHEIGSHTRTHPHLPQLSTQAMLSEVNDSKQALIDIGITPVETFVYPYGEFNASIIQAVKDAGYIGARTVNRGYNTSATDNYVLLEQEIQNTTTFADVKSWVDTAIAQDRWLVLTFHQVDDTGSQYGNSPALFQQIVDYVAATNVDVVTLEEGIKQ